MSNNLTYTTKEEDGIEFYVSNDGETTGMSIRGLARCCGVRRQSILYLLEGVEKTDDKQQNHLLKPLQDDIFIDLGGVDSVENNAKIISSKVCAKIIKYYAYESKNASNDIAKNTLGKFLENGIDNWIKDAVGFKSNVQEIDYEKLNKNLAKLDQLDKICEVMLSQQNEMQKLKVVVEKTLPVVKEYRNVKNGICASFRGLETVLDHLKNEQHVLPTGNLYTLSEWLQTKDITLNHGGLRKLGRTVAETFKTCTVAQPKKKNYLKPNGKWSCNCTAYSEEHFPLLEMALNQFLQN